MPEAKDGQAETGAKADSTVTIVKRRPIPTVLFRVTITTLIIWLILFASGLLIETVPHRLNLAPISTKQQLSKDVAAEVIAAAENVMDKAHPLAFNTIRSFLVATFCFTPINLAFLSMVSGLLGGLASNIWMETMPEKIDGPLPDDIKRRYLYLQEPPVTSAIRGFVVYLCVIAGLYVAIDDPFKSPTPGQYIRLAGLLSVMAYLVGYDPSRLEDWLRLIPGPNSGSKGNQSDKREQQAQPGQT